MSDPLRIAVAVEGPTDAIVLRAIFDALLPDTEFVFQTVQPEISAAFSTTGTGWVGIYRWSRQSVSEGGGSVSASSVLMFHDLLIVQVDADVAGKDYASGSITDAPADDLPCEKPCPPPCDTTNALRSVVLNWLGESTTPPRLVLCTPSKSMETWVFAAICPNNNVVKQSDWECRANPEGQFATLPKEQRFRKRPSDYNTRRHSLTAAWPNVSARLDEAKRFEREFLQAIASQQRHPLKEKITEQQ